MAVWMVRAGASGEFEQKFVQDQRVYVTWDALDVDISELETRDDRHLDPLRANPSPEMLRQAGDVRRGDREAGCLAVAGSGRTLLTPEPGFAMYRVIATITGLNYVAVPLNPADFSLDMPAMLAAIERHRPALVMFAYPTNPTGNLFDRNEVEQLIRASPGLVVIDEAYFNFAGETFIYGLSRYPNVLVLRTLSKMGLAGLRLGILVGHHDWLSEINKVRLPYNINVLSQVSGEFILRHAQVLEAQIRRICVDREALYRGLKELDNIKIWPSRTNFLLMRLAGRADQVFQGLKAAGILIKNLNGIHPLLWDCMRVTIGTPTENRRFYEALKSLLKP